MKVNVRIHFCSYVIVYASTRLEKLFTGNRTMQLYTSEIVLHILALRKLCVCIVRALVQLQNSNEQEKLTGSTEWRHEGRKQAKRTARVYSSKKSQHIVQFEHRHRTLEVVCGKAKVHSLASLSRWMCLCIVSEIDWHAYTRYPLHTFRLYIYVKHVHAEHNSGRILSLSLGFFHDWLSTTH